MFVFNLIFCSLMFPHFFILRLGDFYLHVFLGSCKKVKNQCVFGFIKVTWKGFGKAWISDLCKILVFRG